ncbi:MAG: CfrBI family restriction endonuclease [Fusobacteria bacterium]|nr:CfrBI family restriction endonuclease [Fusobacteriota bacterium]
MSFKDVVIKNTVKKLINGEDYREEVVNAINVEFLDFAVGFFKEIVSAKMESKSIDLEWYKNHFINFDNFASDEVAVYAGINKKTITNIYGSAKKEIVLDVSNENFDYLSKMISSLEDDIDSEISVSIKLTYKSITVELTLTESLLVINALATKKIAIRGGAWSSIGKKVEKPLVDELCRLSGVSETNLDNKVFKKDGTLDFDREVDYKIISKKGEIYRVEVKLMGKGNPESADAIIARDTNIFIADTLSQQNKNQLEFLNVKYLEMKNNKNCIGDFKKILNDLDVPYNS